MSAAEAVKAVDLHGMNAYQAKIALDAVLRRADGSVYRVRAIHGYNAGTALKDFVRAEYAKHPKVIRIAPGPNPGATDLILREW